MDKFSETFRRDHPETSGITVFLKRLQPCKEDAATERHIFLEKAENQTFGDVCSELGLCR